MKKIVLLFVFYVVACTPLEKPTVEEIIERSIASHGWNQNEHTISFDFRDYSYELTRKKGFYSFQRSTEKEGNHLKDVMTSQHPLQRFQNGEQIKLKDSMAKVYSNSLNSVMYFFQLPKPLKDGAVISELLGSTQILDQFYWVVKVSFTEQGGGDDFQDEYRYWINQKNHEIDYLAYNYLTDGGGTRFRKAKNKRTMSGFLFQDYTNYRPQDKRVSLDSLPSLFEKGLLVEVSEIENKNIQISLPD
ncbi:MAG: DUF6503 family protein [Flavobacteriaceae bacterium]